MQTTTEAIQINPNFAEPYHNRGLTKSNLGKYEEAIEDFDKAIQIKPKEATAYYNRGNAKDSLGKYEEAIAGLRQNYSNQTKLCKCLSSIEDFVKSALGKHEGAIARLRQSYCKSTQNMASFL